MKEVLWKGIRFKPKGKNEIIVILWMNGKEYGKEKQDWRKEKRKD